MLKPIFNLENRRFTYNIGFLVVNYLNDRFCYYPKINLSLSEYIINNRLMYKNNYDLSFVMYKNNRFLRI